MSSPARQPPGLPRGISVAAVLCLILSGMTGMYAAMEASSLMNLSQSKENTLKSVSGLGDPAVIERMERVVHAQTSALEPMREPRSLVLGTLAVHAGDLLLPTVREVVRAQVWPRIADGLEIVLRQRHRHTSHG